MARAPYCEKWEWGVACSPKPASVRMYERGAWPPFSMVTSTKYRQPIFVEMYACVNIEQIYQIVKMKLISLYSHRSEASAIITNHQCVAKAKSQLSLQHILILLASAGIAYWHQSNHQISLVAARISCNVSSLLKRVNWHRAAVASCAAWLRPSLTTKQQGKFMSGERKLSYFNCP